MYQMYLVITNAPKAPEYVRSRQQRIISETREEAIRSALNMYSKDEGPISTCIYEIHHGYNLDFKAEINMTEC